MGVVDLGQAHERELIVDLSCFFDVHARRCKILLLLTMSLYRFFTIAGMPSRVPSLSDKEIETPTPVRTCGLSARARGRGYIEPSKSSAKFKSANNILVHTGWGQSAKFNARQIFRLYGRLSGINMHHTVLTIII